MYTLENTKLKKSLIGVGLSVSLILMSGCIDNKPKNIKTTNTNMKSMNKSVDGAIFYETKNGKYTSYYVNNQNIKVTSKGRAPTPTEIAAWDVDVMPDGTGLPKYDTKHGKVVLNADGSKKIAQGSIEWGNELYDAQCSMCHGDFGSGGQGGYPALSGGDIESLTNQLKNPADKVPNEEPPSKRIGSYWPYASTLFWYIQDGMPFPHPKSLSNSETYAIAAYLLMENGVQFNGTDMEEDFIMDQEKYKSIVMPNAKGFYPNVDTPKNPQQGVDNMTKYLSDPKNYGAGKRCMTDCIKGEVPILRIKNELKGITPEPSTLRDLPEVKKTAPEHPGKSEYETSCSACHANAAIGAPVVGNKEAWNSVMEKGIEKVYHNAINGINGMPPKGGNMSLSDAQVKEIIDYMIDDSK
ncbi:Sulfite dehydrogenase cytochrome subunit SoxD [hydrothermal vent metagenome]|uniref:Sulfite dehydrogenase cytochrome subunit SoxD n=1 Tax=hydrothermal vent metagenome TaxID=652676 RepID=A0A3B1DTJ2_9ZZZZ